MALASVREGLSISSTSALVRRRDTLNAEGRAVERISRRFSGRLAQGVQRERNNVQESCLGGVVGCRSTCNLTRILIFLYFHVVWAV